MLIAPEKDEPDAYDSYQRVHTVRFLRFWSGAVRCDALAPGGRVGRGEDRQFFHRNFYGTHSIHDKTIAVRTEVKSARWVDPAGTQTNCPGKEWNRPGEKKKQRWQV